MRIEGKKQLFLMTDQKAFHYCLFPFFSATVHSYADAKKNEKYPCVSQYSVSLLTLSAGWHQILKGFDAIS